MKRSKLWIIVAAALSAMPLACQSGADASAGEEAPAAAAPAKQTGQDKGSGELDASGRAAIPTQRKLIQNAELHVQVDNYAAARHQIDKMLADHGGHVAGAQVHHDDGRVSRAELVLRVPSNKLGDFLAAAAGEGKVLHEKLDTQDITDGYYDLKSRLANAQRLEQRLLAIMSEQTRSMSDLLAVEKELARVREQIEGFEGKLRLWDNQVALSTVRLSLLTKRVYTATAPPTFSERVGDTLGASWSALGTFGRGLVLLLTAMLPWLLPFALVGLCLRAVILKIRDSRRSSDDSASPAPCHNTR